MELVEEVKALLIETAKGLKGSARRLFMARAVHTLGKGGQRLAEQELGWNRGTNSLGQHELECGIVCIDAYTIRLAYYPPYHSKYTPIERCWGILEQHWNGSLLDSVDAVIKYASTMTKDQANILWWNW